MAFVFMDLYLFSVLFCFLKHDDLRRPILVKPDQDAFGDPEHFLRAPDVLLRTRFAVGGQGVFEVRANPNPRGGKSRKAFAEPQFEGAAGIIDEAIHVGLFPLHPVIIRIVVGLAEGFDKFLARGPNVEASPSLAFDNDSAVGGRFLLVQGSDFVAQF
jgi:hypothetical protein